MVAHSCEPYPALWWENANPMVVVDHLEALQLHGQAAFFRLPRVACDSADR